jgi:hypothetical protein
LGPLPLVGVIIRIRLKVLSITTPYINDNKPTTEINTLPIKT